MSVPLWHKGDNIRYPGLAGRPGGQDVQIALLQQLLPSPSAPDLGIAELASGKR